MQSENEALQSAASSRSGLEQIQETLSLGGPVVMLLGVLSLVALAIVLFKSLELFLARYRGAGNVEKALTLWHSNRRTEALSCLSKAPGDIALLVRVAMDARQANRLEPLIREEVQRVAASAMERLRSHLRALEVIGTISPLLGLFGTVLGMIEAFRRMEDAGANVDPSVLSGGIWQALLTTGVGLAVAIPVVLAHQWLERRSDALAHRMEDAVTQVFTADLYRPGQSSVESDEQRSRRAA